MSFTKRQVFTVFSVIALIVLTGLAVYSIQSIKQLSLPVDGAISAFAVILPAVAGVSIETSLAHDRRQRKRISQENNRPSPRTLVFFVVLTIYETVIATLAGTHAGPADSLRCGLDERWKSLFHNKNANAIRNIQNAFQCCGMFTSVDRAWPFPDRNHNQHACEDAFGRTTGCYSGWRGEERRVAAMILVVPIITFAWQTVIVFAPTARPSWMSRMIHGRPADRNARSNIPRPAIEYQQVPEPERFTDDTLGDEEAVEDLAATPRAIEHN